MKGGPFQLVGKYEVVESLGEGGESTIWKARRIGNDAAGIKQGEWVALKILKTRGDGLEERSFRNQARILGGLNHPNIIRYLDSFAFESEDHFVGRFFCLVTEYLEGQTLQQRIDERREGLPWSESRPLLDSILSALAYLSREDGGIVHRDLKPSNIFITKEGVAKLIDFGIARESEAVTSRTSSGEELKGSYDYMAPEYARAQGVFRGDPRSEIFSFGVTAYQTLTGRLPFPRLPANAAVGFFARWTSAEPPEPDLRQGPLRVLKNANQFLNRCLAPKAEARLQDFNAVMEAFRQVEPRRLVCGGETYEFFRHLGKGGFGQVFQARRLSDGGSVAVKILFESVATKRFLLEADLLRRLSHPRLVKYIDFATAPQGPESERSCLVLEYLEGMPEASLLRRIREAPAGLDAAEMVPLFCGYLECLEYLHGQRIYHRDLKPANLYAPAGRPDQGRVFDLGIARDEEQTRTHGFVPGTLNYMPPEFARGGDDRGSAASDIYALAVSLHEALTGELPFGPLPKGDKAAIEGYFARARLGAPEYDALLKLDQPCYRSHPLLERLVRQALRHQPDRRFASAREMRSALLNVLHRTDPTLETRTITDASQLAAVVTLRSGMLVAGGRFQLVRPLFGRTKSGRVWLATDEEQSDEVSNQKVVLRFLPEGVATGPASSHTPGAMDPRAAPLSHPAIARVHAVHAFPDELTVCSTEFVPGTDLREWLAGQPGGRFTGEEIQPVLAQIWQALEIAHSAGLPHGALDPDRILVLPDRSVKVTGFGLGFPTVAPAAEDASRVFAYASPERRAGGRAQFADDMYSLGVILFESVSGHLPSADPTEALDVSRETPLSRSIDTALGLAPGSHCPLKRAAAETIRRCLSRDPKFRPANIREFRLWWRNGPPVLPALPTDTGRADAKRRAPIEQEPDKEPANRGGLQALLFILTIGTTITLLALNWIRNHPAEPPTPPKDHAEEGRFTDRELDVLAKSLRTPRSEPERKLLDLLPDTVRDNLAREPGEQNPPEALRESFLEALSGLVRTSRWDQATFGAATWSAATLAAFQDLDSTNSPAQRNWLILRDVFQETLSPVAVAVAVAGGSNPSPAPNLRKPGTAKLTLTLAEGTAGGVTIEIFTNENATITEPGAQPWFRAADFRGPSLVVSNLSAGRHRLEVGTTPEKSAATWTRRTVVASEGQNAEMKVDLKPAPLEIRLNHRAAVLMQDGWGRFLGAVRPEGFERSIASRDAKAPYIHRAAWPGTRLVLPGDFRLQLSDQAGADVVFEPFDERRRLEPVPGNLPLVFLAQLTPARVPRMDARWTNSLGTSLLPVPGTPPFLAARTETSVPEFRAFAEATGLAAGRMYEISEGGVSLGRTWRDLPPERLALHPVVGVSWHDADRFCQWLTESERRAGRLGQNQHYALPTKLQWDRLVGPQTYPWGTNFPPQPAQGNYAGQEVTSRSAGGWPDTWSKFILDTHDTAWPRTTPIGLYEPAPDRFADLGGNVAEWCRDDYSPSMNPTPWKIRSERLATPGHWKVVRGGAWRDHDEDMMRSASCWAESPDIRTDWLGFRIVLEENQ